MTTSAPPRRTLTKRAAAREFGLSTDALNALIAEGTVWTVRIPGYERPRVVRDGLETWVRAGRKPAAKRDAVFIPREF